VTIVGPDGRAHRLHYRVQRWPSGTGVELVERGNGYHFSAISTLGRHDQPIDAQVRHLRQVAETTIATTQLENRPPDNRVLLSGDAVVGRLVWAGLPGTSAGFENSPYNVVIDGHELTWKQFGQALEAFEGFRFRLILEDNVDEIADPTGT
jgi:hypothetical protein